MGRSYREEDWGSKGVKGRKRTRPTSGGLKGGRESVTFLEIYIPFRMFNGSILAFGGREWTSRSKGNRIIAVDPSMRYLGKNFSWWDSFIDPL